MKINNYILINKVFKILRGEIMNVSIIQCVFLFYFFLSVHGSSRNNISIFNFSIFSGGKLNLFGTLVQNLTFPVVFKSTGKKQNRN